MEAELFEIRLNERGRSVLQKMFTWIRFFYICTIITCVFDFLNALLTYRVYLRYSYSFRGMVKVQTLTGDLFLLIYGTLVPMQAYFFYRFGVRSRRSLVYGNSDEFNESFTWLMKHAVVAAVLFALNCVWAMIITWSEIKLEVLYNR